jgi:hypothetical protein
LCLGHGQAEVAAWSSVFPVNTETLWLPPEPLGRVPD